jgi:PAS domain S-box-containing protein
LPMALIMSAVSIIAALSIGFVASSLSRQYLERRYHDFYLREARLLRAVAQEKSVLSDEQALEAMAKAWDKRGPHPGDEYICVVNSKARLALHTAHPKTVGNYCGKNRVLATSAVPATNLDQLLALQTDYVGDYISSNGQAQIAAFAALPDRGWILGVHRSKDALIKEIGTSFFFLTSAFWLVCGILMPLSLYMVYRSIAADRRHILQTESALRQSEERLRSVLENAEEGFFQSTREGGFLEANPAMARLLGYENADELIGSVNDLASQHYVDPSQRDELWSLLEKEGQVLGFDCRFRRCDGKVVWVSVNARLVKDEMGRTKYMEGFSRDVTATREATERIKEALAEKEVLLREIHHRVKNNMQVISSMLNLQRVQIKDPRDLALLQESQDRVRAMSLIHESLYQSGNLADIDLKSYIASLANGLLVAYDKRGPGFDLEVEADGVRLGVDQAIPCGLVLNELISNALKHAYPGESRGLLRIKVFQADGMVHLEIEDNGIGLPPGFAVDPNGAGLGLSLVQGLAENQLQGSFQLQGNGGVRALVTFPARAR